MEKYLVIKGPYLRSADITKRNTSTIMRDVLIALLPSIAFAIYKNVVLVLINGIYSSIYHAIYPIITLILAPLTSLICEAISLWVMKKRGIKTFKDLVEELKVSYGIFPGLFIVLISPTYIPLWVLLVSVAVGEVVGKMLFGGFGQNIFNPALVGRAFMAFTFSSHLGDAYLTSYELTIDAYSAATPLTSYAKAGAASIDIVNNYGGMFNLLIGNYPGALGETSTIAILIGAIYLIIKDVIDWRIPVVYLGTMFFITMIIGFIMGQGLWFPLFQILTGGVAFGAVFMATEPVTSPKTHLGRIMYALLLGELTVLFRLVGNMPEGVATSIVTMNIVGLMINKYVTKLRVEDKLTKKNCYGLVIFLVFFVLLFVYDVVMGVK